MRVLVLGSLALLPLTAPAQPQPPLPPSDPPARFEVYHGYQARTAPEWSTAGGERRAKLTFDRNFSDRLGLVLYSASVGSFSSAGVTYSFLAGPQIGLVAAIVGYVALQRPPASAQESHPLTGTWKLNLAKSTYNPPELAQRSILATYHVKGDTITALLEGVDYLGRAVRSEYTARFDGSEHPTKGTIDGKPAPNQNAISWKKVNDLTYEVHNILKGQVLTTQRIVIAADRRSRTTTITGQDAQGRTVNNVLFFERQ